MRIEISKEFRFEAAHRLTHHGGKCANLHGHSWLVKVTLSGEPSGPNDFVVDYYDFSQVVKERVVDVLDHQYLGDGYAEIYVDNAPSPGCCPPLALDGIYPCSENLVKWIAEQLLLPGGVEGLSATARLERVELQETCTSAAVWTRENWEKEQENG